MRKKLVRGHRPNNSFKPNLLRYGNNMARKACHVVTSTTQVGLTQALDAGRSSPGKHASIKLIRLHSPKMY